MANKLTLLDILSTMEVTPEILTRRAAYWTTVAVRHDRNNRPEQAARLRTAVRKMKKEAKRLAALDVVIIDATDEVAALAAAETAIADYETRPKSRRTRRAI